MNVLARLRARLRRTDIAPIGDRLDRQLSEADFARQLSLDAKSAFLANLDALALHLAASVAAALREDRPDVDVATDPDPDVVGLDGVLPLLGRIRAHVFDDTVNQWTPDVLPDVSDTALPVVHEFLAHLEAEIPAHKWALRWRIADVAHRYGLDEVDRGGAG